MKEGGGISTLFVCWMECRKLIVDGLSSIK
jgi:hypothetical protein